MNSLATEITALGHVASHIQLRAVVSAWINQGDSWDTIISRLSQDLFYGRNELNGRAPIATIEYTIKDERIYSESYQCFLTDLYEPDPKKLTADYVFMMERNKNNLRLMEQELIKSLKNPDKNGPKEILVCSPATDYNSDHSVIYRYRVEANGKIYCDCIDAPKDINDLKIFIKNLTNQEPEIIFDQDNTAVGLKNVVNTEVSNWKNIDIIKHLETFAGKEDALLERWQSLNYELKDAYDYAKTELEKTRKELELKFSQSDFDNGKFESLFKLMHEISTELKNYEMYTYQEIANELPQKNSTKIEFNNIKTEDILIERIDLTSVYKVNNKTVNTKEFISRNPLSNGDRNEYTDSNGHTDLNNPKNNKPEQNKLYQQVNTPDFETIESKKSSYEYNNHSTNFIQLKSDSSLNQQSIPTNELPKQYQDSHTVINRILDNIYRAQSALKTDIQYLIAHHLLSPNLSKITQIFSLNSNLTSIRSKIFHQDKGANNLVTNYAKQALLKIKNLLLPKAQVATTYETLPPKSKKTLNRFEFKAIGFLRTEVYELTERITFLKKLILNFPTKDKLLPEQSPRQHKIQLAKFELSKSVKQLNVILEDKKNLISLAKNLNYNDFLKLIKVISVNHFKQILLVRTNLIRQSEPTRLNLIKSLSQRLNRLLAQNNKEISLQNFVIKVSKIRSLLLRINLDNHNSKLSSNYKISVSNLQILSKILKSKYLELKPKNKFPLSSVHKNLAKIIKMINQQLESIIKIRAVLNSTQTKTNLRLHPKIILLLLELIKSGVLDDLLADEEDWLLSLLEMRVQKNKRQMRLFRSDTKDKIKKLRFKFYRKNRHYQPTLTEGSNSKKSVMKKASFIDSRTIIGTPSYELFPRMTIASFDSEE